MDSAGDYRDVELLESDLAAAQVELDELRRQLEGERNGYGRIVARAVNAEKQLALCRSYRRSLVHVLASPNCERCRDSRPVVEDMGLGVSGVVHRTYKGEPAKLRCREPALWCW